MKIFLIRHGMTPGNALRRYIGRTDEALSPEGIAEAEKIGAAAEVKSVYVTPLIRTQQTAKILFPNAKQTVLSGLREMDFGVFENRSADEMENDAAYHRWVDGNCLGECPEGESTQDFAERVCACFEREIVHLIDEKAQRAVFVVHGGTIMSILHGFTRPQVGYYDVLVKNCRGYVCETAQGEGELPFTLTGLKAIERYTESD